MALGINKTFAKGKRFCSSFEVHARALSFAYCGAGSCICTSCKRKQAAAAFALRLCDMHKTERAANNHLKSATREVIREHSFLTPLLFSNFVAAGTKKNVTKGVFNLDCRTSTLEV